ncbi:hypothetical protein [Candidatus Spongiihabitans sp.]|uniref:hypothetical protein n=1 Tax=Candidatus Spongiihabitans sp. TaxID=3101308 RepID=UPI003C7E3C26
MIKRYKAAIKHANTKTIFRKLRHSLRATKARSCWKNAHLLLFSGIATPAPYAFVEKRWGPFRLDSYYVCAFNDFPTAAEKYQYQLPTKQEIIWFKKLLETLFLAQIYYRDFHADNILISDDGIIAIDINSVKDFSSKTSHQFLCQHRKDKSRFLRDWKSKPEQLQCFSEVFGKN